MPPLPSTTFSFYMGPRGLSSGLHTCSASVLSTSTSAYAMERWPYWAHLFTIASRKKLKFRVCSSLLTCFSSMPEPLILLSCLYFMPTAPLGVGSDCSHFSHQPCPTHLPMNNSAILPSLEACPDSYDLSWVHHILGTWITFYLSFHSGFIY